MPFVIVKGSDVDKIDRRNHGHASSRIDHKKNNIEDRYFHQTDYNYKSFNNIVPESSSGIFVEPTRANDEPEVTYSYHSTGEPAIINRVESADDLHLPVNGASRDMRDVLDFKVRIL